jgi:hypothetical protein
MAIDRVTPSGPLLTIPQRIAGEQPGQRPLIAPVAQEPGQDASFTPPGALPGALDGPDLLPPAQGSLAQMTSVLAAEALLAGEPAAMRPDQVFMARQLTWPQQMDPHALAASWNIMVRTYAEQRAALLDQARGQHLPAGLFMADRTPLPARDGERSMALVTELDAWRFAVYAWGAARLVLRVVSREPADYEGPQRRRRRRVALRLELQLAQLGRVVVQLEPAGDSVLLELGAEQPNAMQHLRELLPLLAAAVGQAGLSIRRCRVARTLDPLHPELHLPDRAQAALLTPAIFKAMADIALLLSQPPQTDTLAEQAE